MSFLRPGVIKQLLALPNPLSCLVMNKICLNQTSQTRVIIKVKGHQHWWLAGGYDLEIGHF